MAASNLLRRLCAVCLSAAVALATAAAEAKVTLAVTPSEISLEQGLTEQEVVVTAEPDPSHSFVEARLQIIVSPGLVATPVAEPTLPQAGILAWTVRFRAERNAPAASTATFRLDYRTAAGDATTAGTVATSAKVAFEPYALLKSVKATLHKGSALLEPAKTYVAYLVLENSGARDAILASVTKQAVARDAPESLALGPPKNLPLTIPARSSATLPLEIVPAERVPPGEATLILSLALSEPGSTAPAETLLLVEKVNLGIAGLSDITTALQVPSLLFLPGFLIVLTATLLWSLRGGAALALSPKSGEFYVVAVTLSLAAAAVYAWYLNEPFNLLARISVTDVAVLWFWSIVAGILLFVGAVLWTWNEGRRERARAAAEAAKNPQTADDAAAIVRKLGGRAGSLLLDSYSVTEGRDVQIVFDLGFGKADAGKFWAVPRIEIETDDNAVGGRIDEFIQNADAAGLAAYLAGDGKACTVRWEPGGKLSAPTVLVRADVGPTGRQPLVVRA